MNSDGLADQSGHWSDIRTPQAIISIKHGTHSAEGLAPSSDPTGTVHADISRAADNPVFQVQIDNKVQLEELEEEV